MWTLVALWACRPGPPDEPATPYEPSDPPTTPEAVCLGATAEVGWRDADGDGFGDPAAAVIGCPPEGVVDNALDCDDAASAVHPGAVEACDTLDNDCNGLVDVDAPEAVPWYDDSDLDGHGDPDVATWACVAPEGFVAEPSDCDDAEPGVHPGVEEVCGNDHDDDCDGEAVGCGVAGTSSLADAVVFRGEGAGDHFGQAVLLGEDLTEDGVPDVVISAYATGDLRGRLYLMPGTAGVRPNPADLAGAIRLQGPEDYEGLGQTLAAEDIDGDGHPDLVVGEHATFAGPCGYEGSVRVWFGPFDGARPDSLQLCANPPAGLGFQLAAPGDLTGDGLPDVLLGSEVDYETGESLLFVVKGPIGRGFLNVETDEDVYRLTTTGNSRNWYQYPNRRLEAAADLDGDGVLDIAYGVPDPIASVTNGVRLFFGPIDGDREAADVEIDGGGSRDGHAVASAGDLDGDGIDDLLVGAPGSALGSELGEVYLVPGGLWDPTVELADAAFATLVGEVDGDLAGSAVEPAGDVDGDGLPEIVVLATESDRTGTNAGEVYVVSGPFAGTLELADAMGRWGGEDPGDGLPSDGSGGAFRLFRGADVDGDGYSDVAVGTIAQSRAGVDAGAVYLLFGGPGF